MAAAKECLAIVLDVGRGMRARLDAGSRLDAALQALELLLQQKILFSKRDEVALIRVGTLETRNKLADAEYYRHVVAPERLEPLTLELLRSVRKLESEDADGDVLDGLIVAQELLREAKAAAKGKGPGFRVLVLTDASGTVNSPEQVEEIGERFRGLACRVDIVGVGFHEDGAGIDAPKTARDRNEALLRRLVEVAGGQVLPVSRAVEMMSALRSRSVNVVTKMRGELNIGDIVRIPVWSYPMASETKLASLKKRTMRPVPAGESDVVRMLREYRNRDTRAAVEVEDRIRSHRFGKDFFPVGPAEEALLKLETERCLEVLGFTARRNVPRHWSMAGVDLLLPAAPTDTGSPEAERALSALARALAETDRVAIARYVKRKNAAPALVALTPHLIEYAREDAGVGGSLSGPDSIPEDGLFVCQLPFADDTRDFAFAPFTTLDRFKPSEAQLDAMDAFIDALDLSKPLGGVEVGQAYDPTTTFNPTLLRFYQTLGARTIDEAAPVTRVDPAIEAFLSRNPFLVERAKPAAELLRACFPLRRNEAAAAKRKRFWGEVAGAPAASSSSASPSALAPVEATVADPKDKRGRGDEGDLAGLLGRSEHDDRVNSVGGVNPIKDFRAMLQRTDVDLTAAAMTGMQRQIERILLDPALQDRALECLRALREEAIRNYHEAGFNTFLRDLKVRCSDTSAPTSPEARFWARVVAAHLSLIHNDESASSEISREQADEFLVAPTPLLPSAAVAHSAPSVTVDDLDDMA